MTDDEITPSTHLPHAPDARAQAGPTHHQGADYGEPDTEVTVFDGVQCTYAGEPYRGESVRVPRAVAEHWVRSGWASAELDTVPETAESDDDSTAESDERPVKAAAPPAGRQVKAGAGRRTTRK